MPSEMGLSYSVHSLCCTIQSKVEKERERFNANAAQVYGG